MPRRHARRIVLDATPLASGHGIRGIGRYVGGVIAAMATEEPEFVELHVRLLVTSGQEVPAGRWRTVTTIRAGVRPQDIGWAVAAVADRRLAGALGRTWWHQTDPTLPWSPVGGARTLATAYDLIPLHETEVWRRIRPHRRVLYRAYLDALRRARVVVAISATTAVDLTRTLGIPANRIRVLPPAVTAPPAAGLAPVDHDAPALLFVGVMDPHKRPELALETLAAVRRRRPAARLSFVGPSPARRVDELRRHAAALGVGDAVDYRGTISEDELTALYRGGILLAVSRIEGFGLPPVEAILAGGRAVAVPSPIYREVLSDAATYAVGDQPGAIADAVMAALEGAPSESARTSLAARVAPRQSAARLRAMYEEIAE